MRNLILVIYARNHFLKVQLFFHTINHLFTLKNEDKEYVEPSFYKSTFVDCGKTIKIEDIKDEINKVESVDDPLSIHQDTENSNICEVIKEEVKEEESVDDPLFIQEGRQRSESNNICTEVKEELIDDDPLYVQEIHNSGDEENDTVANEIDIVEHKIEIDN